MDLQLKGLKAIVTGGTKGIGLAIARTLAAEGADVAICARDAASVQSTANALAELGGARASGEAVDVSNGAALKAWVGRVGADWGGLDIVVANVSALAIGNDIESWRKEFNTDLLGSVNLVDAAMPFLTASKAALVHSMQGLANQLASKSIRANTVSPGNVYFEVGVWASPHGHLAGTRGPSDAHLTGFHADQARRQLPDQRHELITGDLRLDQSRLARFVHTMDGIHILARSILTMTMDTDFPSCWH
jgi:NAD(P)-dependent dehydrogenase (short-subunit alcohol dehydrogenase family)